MRASELGKQWAEPNNNELTSKQYSLRLPIHVAAKIEAIAEMFPSRNRTEIMGDLLAAALTEFESGLMQKIAEPDDIDDLGQQIIREVGRKQEFCELTSKYIELLRHQGAGKSK